MKESTEATMHGTTTIGVNAYRHVKHQVLKLLVLQNAGAPSLLLHAAARQMDLSPSGTLYHCSQAPLPDVTVVFASVVGASSFTLKRAATRYVNKVIQRCMLQQLAAVPGGDGYLCRVSVAKAVAAAHTASRAQHRT